MLAGFFITLASQDELRERLGRRVPQTGCHLHTLLDWGSSSRPSPVAGQGWQFENKCIFLDTWYLLLSGAHSNGKSWQSYFLRLINNFEVSSNRQIKPTMSSSFSSPLRDAVIVSYLTSHSSTTFSTFIQYESTFSLSLSNATRALIIGEWETQVQFVLTDHPTTHLKSIALCTLPVHPKTLSPLRVLCTREKMSTCFKLLQYLIDQYFCLK